MFNDPSWTSKVNDFCVIWKSLNDFLLVVNSNIGPGPIFDRFWDTAGLALKIHIFLPSAFNPKFENVSYALDR